jgi:hypothetical protein
LNQVSPLPQMGLEEMPNKKMKAAKREFNARLIRITQFGSILFARKHN